MHVHAQNHLAAKLLQIRQRLGLSQPKLATILGVRDYTDISKYERNVNEAPLLCYSLTPAVPMFHWNRSWTIN
jgi:transcriptional regulator with XRE-family HTH domain